MYHFNVSFYLDIVHLSLLYIHVLFQKLYIPLWLTYKVLYNKNYLNCDNELQENLHDTKSLFYFDNAEESAQDIKASVTQNNTGM